MAFQAISRFSYCPYLRADDRISRRRRALSEFGGRSEPALPNQLSVSRPPGVPNTSRTKSGMQAIRRANHEPARTLSLLLRVVPLFKVDGSSLREHRHPCS